MDLWDALGDDITAEFATRRQELPQALLYEPHVAEPAVEALSQHIQGRTALVVADARTWEVAGRGLAKALRGAGWTAPECHIPDQGDGAVPICDDLTKDELQANLPTADVFVAVGSGVVNDLTKWLAAEAGVPYAVCATAASMNGYSAANVAPSIDGIKSLFRAKAPRIIAADPQVIANAPYRLTASGLGDVIAKPVSTADWMVNQELFGEDFSPAVAAVIDRCEPQYLDHPEALERREPAAVQTLFDALVLSGCAMTLQGSSLPASGGEHLVSHTLDMLSHVGGWEHDLHGRQVGVATIVAAALYQRILELEAPPLRADRLVFDADLWGPIASAVEPEYRAKKQRLAEVCERLAEPGRWDALRARLAPVLRDPRTIKDCLREAGAAHRLEDIGCSRERFLVALRNCGTMRARFTSVDLAHVVGVLPGQAESIIDAWVA